MSSLLFSKKKFVTYSVLLLQTDFPDTKIFINTYWVDEMAEEASVC